MAASRGEQPHMMMCHPGVILVASRAYILPMYFVSFAMICSYLNWLDRL